MNQKGFIASALLYGMLALFLVIMISTLLVMANNKMSMDRLKQEALSKVGTPMEETSSLDYDYAYRPGYYDYHLGSNIGLGDSVDISNFVQNPTMLDRQYYLGYDIEGGIVTALYACFIIDNKQYCMKGTNDSSSTGTNVSILSKLVNDEKITCNNLNVSETNGVAICSGSEIGYLYVSSGGAAYAGISDSIFCGAYFRGYSRCNE